MRRTFTPAALLLTGALLGFPGAATAGPPGDYFDGTFVNTVACSFPVQWEISGRDVGMDLPTHGFGITTQQRVTITNLDSGVSWSPNGDGSLTFSEDEDGNGMVAAHGVVYWPNLGLQTTGSFSRTFFSDGTASDVTGHGKKVDICAVLG